MAEATAVDVLDHIVEALRRTELRRDPWPHCHIPDALPESTAKSIAAGFQGFDLASVEGKNRQKTYRMRTRRLAAEAADELPSPVWGRLVAALSHDRYRDAMAELIGLDLGDADLTLDLWEYRDGDWLAPHVDKPEKLATQLFYFSQSWHPEAGGRLLVLDRAASEEPAALIHPVTGSSAVLVRSDSSWHAVEASRGAQTSRCSIAATFWAKGSAPSYVKETD